MGCVSTLFEVAGQLAALGALLMSGLVQDLVSPSRVLLVCGLLSLASCFGTALRYA